MNKILRLKGQFQQRKNSSKMGPTNLPKGGKVTAEHLKNLKIQLQRIEKLWHTDRTIRGALISVHHTCIVAKSNRLRSLLREKSANDYPNASIRGAKFVEEGLVKKHVITYFISYGALNRAIQELADCERIVREDYHGVITEEKTKIINDEGIHSKAMAKSRFLNTIRDAYYVEHFQVDRAEEEIVDESIITLYKTGVETVELLDKFGIDMINAKMIDETTLRLRPDEIALIQSHAPYLIAMHVKNFSTLTKEDFPAYITEEKITIPEPTNEPVIGVIDTHFDDKVYFSAWVDYENMLSDDFEIRTIDRCHGTQVSSIIVDGPTFNPKLDDGCGRFRVRHFGVAMADGFSSFTILKSVRNIVAQNRDIKVWNLSLGSALEVDRNFISPEAAELDRIQAVFDVVFIVAGTNRKRHEPEKRIGAPADSINALVVNSANMHGDSASYTRKGPVLNFFYKPDVCYYGGDDDEMMVVCEPFGRATVQGTSYAAPWISRKMAYLIHVVGLSREVAKALIIDSAAGWQRKDDTTFAMGYGVVPIAIEDIIKSKDDEIRFIMTGTIDEYETYTYNIPVPQVMNAHPFFAKATLAYFPGSDRNQGVDYTSTEMDLHFGRIKEEKKNVKGIEKVTVRIKAIDNNKQSDEGVKGIYEEDARRLYRKWDNVKHICEALKERGKPRKVYQAGMWGLSIKTKERLKAGAGRGLKFGVVVTLKEMNGKNRIEEFMKLCLLRGWIVNEIDVENQIDVYNRAEEKIEFEE